MSFNLSFGRSSIDVALGLDPFGRLVVSRLSLAPCVKAGEKKIGNAWDPQVGNDDFQLRKRGPKGPKVMKRVMSNNAKSPCQINVQPLYQLD